MHQLALGAGTGTGSCRAFPYRAAQVPFCLTCSCRSLLQLMKRNGEPDSIPLQFFLRLTGTFVPQTCHAATSMVTAGLGYVVVCWRWLRMAWGMRITWHVVDHLEHESTQPLHAARSTIHTIHYLEAWCCSRRSTHSSLSTPSPHFFGSEDHTAI